MPRTQVKQAMIALGFGMEKLRGGESVGIRLLVKEDVRIQRLFLPTVSASNVVVEGLWVEDQETRRCPCPCCKTNHCSRNCQCDNLLNPAGGGSLPGEVFSKNSPVSFDVLVRKGQSLFLQIQNLGGASLSFSACAFAVKV